MKKIILASTSPYRKALLERFGIPFACHAPKIEEIEMAGESPFEMAQRLALEKAWAVATVFPDALAIGSDQVASIGDEVLRKPGTIERAVSQLLAMRGREHRLNTAVAVIGNGKAITFFDIAKLWVNAALTEREVRNYVQADQPLNCAGSYKIESRGIALFSKIECDDWNAIVGLPMIKLTTVLREFGIAFFAGE